MYIIDINDNHICMNMRMCIIFIHASIYSYMCIKKL